MGQWVLRLKFALGLFDHPYVPASASSIALVGPLADSAIDMLGCWHARGDAKDVVTLRAALTARVQQAGGQIAYAAGTKIVTKDDSGFAEAVAAAKQADVVVMAVGEDAQWMTGALCRTKKEGRANCQKRKRLLGPNGPGFCLGTFCKPFKRMAGTTGLEPAASAVTGQQ